MVVLLLLPLVRMGAGLPGLGVGGVIRKETLRVRLGREGEVVEDVLPVVVEGEEVVDVVEGGSSMLIVSY